MRVLVTGAAGFVGRHLVPRLAGCGFSVIATDRELDVTDAAAVEARIAAAAPDAIVHLAAQSSPAQSLRAPADTYRVNFVGARSVLAATARCAPRCRVLLAGSGAQYGPGEPGAAPFAESAPLRPASPYARSKAAADLLGASYAERGLEVVRARAFNHTGPGQSPGFAAADFARQLAEMERGQREPLLRVGNLDSLRDFLDVRDVVEAYARLLDPEVPAGAYNVARGSGIRIGELLDALLARARVRPEIRVDPERLRPSDASLGDAARLRRRTGWAPRIPLADTLEAVLEDWRGRISGP